MDAVIEFFLLGVLWLVPVIWAVSVHHSGGPRTSWRGIPKGGIGI